MHRLQNIGTQLDLQSWKFIRLASCEWVSLPNPTTQVAGQRGKREREHQTRCLDWMTGRSWISFSHQRAWWLLRKWNSISLSEEVGQAAEAGQEDGWLLGQILPFIPLSHTHTHTLSLSLMHWVCTLTMHAIPYLIFGPHGIFGTNGLLAGWTLGTPEQSAHTNINKQ